MKSLIILCACSDDTQVHIRRIACSLFIEFKGKSKDAAFKLGQEIADAVTAANPKPVKLRFEKVTSFLGVALSHSCMYHTPRHCGHTKFSFASNGKGVSFSVWVFVSCCLFVVFLQVYLPCVLQTKKRYVGFMYETPDQVQPVYDAKGIETVRRDTCAAVAKVS